MENIEQGAEEQQRGDEAIRAYNEQHRIDPDCAFGAVRKIVNSLVTAKLWIDLFVFGCICIVNYFGTEYSFIGTIITLVTAVVFIIMKTVLCMKGHLDGEHIFEYAVAMYAIAAPLLVFSLLMGHVMVVGEPIGDKDEQQGIFMVSVVFPNVIVSMTIFSYMMVGCIKYRIYIETVRVMEHKIRNAIIALVVDSALFALFLYSIIGAVVMVTLGCFTIWPKKNNLEDSVSRANTKQCDGGGAQELVFR